MEHKMVMTIGREFGSGGREIGKLAAQKLGLPYYDKELIVLAAEKSGLSPEYLAGLDEQSVSSFLYSFSGANFSMGMRSGSVNLLPPADQLFLSQSEVIRDIAAQGGAVIVGRCADYVLQEKGPHVNVFVQAPMRSRIRRVMERHELDQKAAEALMLKTDKNRANYYFHFTGEKWGDRKCFDLVLSSAIGIEPSVNMIVDYYLQVEAGLQK
ncbi:AAA family ATPase [Oscillibacter sp. GMB15532]|uniref:cytidylate kinase-like family protein n=1 Tax=Oscillibacter sp. GMB15532 TaxID=3230022 RepID=UPI0034DFBFA6